MTLLFLFTLIKSSQCIGSFKMPSFVMEMYFLSQHYCLNVGSTFAISNTDSSVQDPVLLFSQIRIRSSVPRTKGDCDYCFIG